MPPPAEAALPPPKFEERRVLPDRRRAGRLPITLPEPAPAVVRYSDVVNDHPNHARAARLMAGLAAAIVAIIAFSIAAITALSYVAMFRSLVSQL